MSDHVRGHAIDVHANMEAAARYLRERYGQVRRDWRRYAPSAFTGRALDEAAAVYGLSRAPGELDIFLRARIRRAIDDDPTLLDRLSFSPSPNREEAPVGAPHNPYDRRARGRIAGAGRTEEADLAAPRLRRVAGRVSTDHEGLTVTDLDEVVRSKVERARIDGEELAEVRFEEINLAAQRDAYDHGFDAGTDFGGRRVHDAMLRAAADRLTRTGMAAIEATDPKKRLTRDELREALSAVSREMQNIMGLLADRLRPELILTARRDVPIDELVREFLDDGAGA